MAKWVNRSLIQAPRNGTTSHTISFTAASAGNLLVAVVEGAVTSTTPTGWTLPTGGSAINNTGLYVWYKTATAGESSLTTTHNGSNYPVGFLVYEFPAGSSFVKSVAGTGLSASAANPSLTGLTGTNLLYGAAAVDNPLSSAMSAVWSGTGSPVEDLDVNVVASGTDGYWFGVAYVEDSAATSFQPTATVSNASNTKEALTFAVNVASSTPIVTGSAAVGVGLAGAVVSVASAAGALALGLALSGVAVPVAVATGSLPAAAGLTGTATQTPTYTVTGSAPTALALTGTASTVAATTGVLNLGAGFTGQASTVGSFAATGNLPLTATLNGAASTTATVTGALPVIAGLTGAATTPTIPTITGALPTGAGLTGAANIVALTTGTLPITTGLTGVSANPSTERDLWLTTTPLPDRWGTAPVPDRWGTAELAPRWATTPLENLMATTILASAGAKQYVGGTVTELTGKDISAATFQIALGSIAAPPTTWSVPDVSVAGTTAAQRVVKLLVTNTTPPGTYWVWVRVTDNPEIEPLTVQGPITIA